MNSPEDGPARSLRSLCGHATSEQSVASLPTTRQRAPTGSST